MNVADRIEELFGVKLEQQGRGDYKYSGNQITEEQVRQVVETTNTEFQDPHSITCGNDDGVAYVIIYVPDDDGEQWDVYVGIDMNDKMIAVS